MFGVPLSQCVEAAPWRKRSACTSASTGTDIPEITSPTASKASRSDSRTSVGSTISVQERVIQFFGYFSKDNLVIFYYNAMEKSYCDFFTKLIKEGNHCEI